MRYWDHIEALRAPTTQDPYSGNETRDWANAAATPLRADVQPQSTTESTDRRQLVIDRWTVICPPADVSATDRIRWEGLDYEVDGEVGRFKRHGQLHHLEFTIRHLTGG